MKMRHQTTVDFAMRSLRRRWAAWAVVMVFTPAGFRRLLLEGWTAEQYRWFLILCYLVVTYQLFFLYRNLYLNYREGETAILETFGPGNLVSMLRGLLLGLLAGFLCLPRPAGWQAWLPALLYTAGDVMDYIDGYLARRSNHVTALGERLDIEWDALGLLVATSLAVSYGILPWLFLPIGFARYGFLIGIWIRRHNGQPVHDLPPSMSRRPIAGLTMGYMSAMLWPIMPYPASSIAGAIFFMPFALSFVRDWLVVSGSIDPQSITYVRLRTSLRNILLNWIPILLRIMIFIFLSQRSWTKITAFSQTVKQFDTYGFPYPTVVVSMFGIIEVVAITAISLGFAGRFAAFLLIFPIGFTIIAGGLDMTGIVLLVSTLLLLMLGTGRYSLWQPSDIIFGRRAGER